MPASVFSLLGMLAVVLAVLFLSYWVTKKLAGMQTGGTGRVLFSPGRAGNAQRGDFCVLAQISLGQNERVVLLRVQKACYLLGVTAGTVTLLKELELEDAREWMAEPEPQAPGFLEILKENIRKRK